MSFIDVFLELLRDTGLDTVLIIFFSVYVTSAVVHLLWKSYESFVIGSPPPPDPRKISIYDFPSDEDGYHLE